MELDAGLRIGGHAGRVVRAAFSPEGRRFVVGDLAGALVVHALDGEVLARAVTTHRVYAVAWSPDDSTIASMEGDVLRLRRASDLAVIAERPDVAVGPLAFGGKGAWVAVGAGRELAVLSVPSLEPIVTVPVERSSRDIFCLDAMTSDPSGDLVVTSDDGGRDEDDRGNTTGRDPAQVTLFDARSGKVIAAVDVGRPAREVHFDPWRRRLYVVTAAGTSVRDPSGEAVARWRGSEGRPAKHLAVTPELLVTLDGEGAIDVWGAWTLELIDHLEPSADGAPTWLVASPDGSTLLAGSPGPAGDHGFWIRRVIEGESDGPGHPVELARRCGPIVDADTLSDEEVARAVAEGRVMKYRSTSNFGDRDVWLTSSLRPDERPSFVLARRPPPHLSTVASPAWDSFDDVCHMLEVRKSKRVRRIPYVRRPRTVLPTVVHEGRGGHIAIDEGWKVYRYPFDLVADGRFCIHFPAGNRLKDRDVHLEALEKLCRDEPDKWVLERRDRPERR